MKTEPPYPWPFLSTEKRTFLGHHCSSFPQGTEGSQLQKCPDIQITPLAELEQMWSVRRGEAWE